MEVKAPREAHPSIKTKYIHIDSIQNKQMNKIYKMSKHK